MASQLRTIAGVSRLPLAAKLSPRLAAWLSLQIAWHARMASQLGSSARRNQTRQGASRSHDSANSRPRAGSLQYPPGYMDGARYYRIPWGVAILPVPGEELYRVSSFR